MNAFETGPYLNGAFLCERVLTEADGTNTYVRVIDRIARQIVAPERPTAPLPHKVMLILVLLLKHGEGRGPFAVALRIERPSGEQQTIHERTINLGGPAGGGVNFHFGLELDMDQAGLWWIDVLGGETLKLMTRVPLELQDQWMKGGPTPGPSPGQ
jgi:hypothetical protein